MEGVHMYAHTDIQSHFILIMVCIVALTQFLYSSLEVNTLYF